MAAALGSMLAGSANLQSSAQQLALQREEYALQQKTHALERETFRVEREEFMCMLRLQQTANELTREAARKSAARRREDNFRRKVDNSRRIVDISAERLASLSNLAALFAGFSIVAFVELDIPTSTSVYLTTVFSIVTTTTISLLIVSMVTTLMMMLYMRSFPAVRSHLPRVKPGDGRPGNLISFPSFRVWWQQHFRVWWTISVFAFLVGVLFFLLTLMVVGWIKFPAAAESAMSFVPPVLQTVIALATFILLIVVYTLIGACKLVNLGVIGVEPLSGAFRVELSPPALPALPMRRVRRCHDRPFEHGHCALRRGAPPDSQHETAPPPPPPPPLLPRRDLPADRCWDGQRRDWRAVGRRRTHAGSLALVHRRKRGRDEGAQRSACGGEGKASSKRR